MTDTDREIPWRQGHVLGSALAAALDLRHPESPGDTVVVVVSHDCDLVNEEKEPNAEVVIGRTIAALGAASYAKVARRLHIEFSKQSGNVAVELEAPLKRTVSKACLVGQSPNLDFRLDAKNRETLQRWLAARYRRTALPDEFNRRLKAKLIEKVKKALDPAGPYVRAVFLDFDDGATVERKGPSDLYVLQVTLLYDSAKNEPEAYAAAEKAAEKIEDIFEGEFRSSETGQWRDIHFTGCDVISDNAITVAQSELLRRWDLDDRSLRREPPETMLD